MSIHARVLIVDDDAALRIALGRMLTDEGCEVVEAGDGGGALKALHLIAPDIILTDIVMPGMEGLELLLALRKFAKRPKIIAMSGGGRAPEDYLALATQFGANATLAKPFTKELLLDTITSVMAK